MQIYFDNPDQSPATVHIAGTGCAGPAVVSTSPADGDITVTYGSPVHAGGNIGYIQLKKGSTPVVLLYTEFYCYNHSFKETGHKFLTA